LKLEHLFKQMKYFKIFILTLILINFNNIGFSKDIHFVDLKKVLNESKAGKNAQNFLKKKFENENKKFEKEGADIKKEESDLIAKKKIISPEEYKKNLTALRQKSINYQNNRRKASNEWVKKKNEARAKLLEALNPIMQKYMKENNVEIIVDKKYILLANSDFEITDKILKILDKELKSINLN
tara:strand:+ start:2857 stop:3405 length:549 start_codon:yes stop_codon:yes gene_type:complete